MPPLSLQPPYALSQKFVHSIYVCVCLCYQSYLISVTFSSANLGEVDSIDDSSEERTLGACEIPSAVQCGQEQCSHGKQGMSPSLASHTL